MQKIKTISISAGFGFILSFVFGLFSHSQFYIILIKAFIFAVVFALIGFLVSFLFSKYLDGDASGDFGNDSGEGASTSSQPGQKVNFVVEDQEFERGDSDNHFNVDGKHQMLNETDVSGQSAEIQQRTEDKFVPLKKVETVDNISGTESVNSSSVQSVTSVSEDNSVVKNNQDAVSEGIDTLPDMDSLGFENMATASSSSEEEDDYDSGDEFSKSVSHRSGNKEEPEIKDAALMAKAISSVLSSEEQ